MTKGNKPCELLTLMAWPKAFSRNFHFHFSRNIHYYSLHSISSLIMNSTILTIDDKTKQTLRTTDSDGTAESIFAEPVQRKRRTDSQVPSSVPARPENVDDHGHLNQGTVGTGGTEHGTASVKRVKCKVVARGEQFEWPLQRVAPRVL